MMITVSPGLYSMCTSAEWNLCGRIISELGENMLWVCSADLKRSSSSVHRSIRGLVEKNVLNVTEVMHTYQVNSAYICLPKLQQEDSLESDPVLVYRPKRLP